MRPQLWQTVSRIFLILTTKPETVRLGARIDARRQILTDMKDGGGELNVTKVARADLDVLFARRARVHAIDSAELGIVKTLFARFLLLFVHSLRVDDMDYAHGLDFFGREQPELDLLDGPERTFRHGRRAGRHVDGRRSVVRVRASLETVLPVVAGAAGSRDGHGGLPPRIKKVVRLP